jgi:predicted Zn-dependent protease
MIDVPRDDLVIMLEAGYIYLAMKKFKEAREVFEGVGILAPKHDIPQVAIANVYFAQSKFLESIRVLKQALKDTPRSAFAYSHLGESQLFYGKRDEAYESLLLASEMEPGGKSGDFARSLIKLMDEGYDPKILRKAHQQAVDKMKAQHQEQKQREREKKA